MRSSTSRPTRRYQGRLAGGGCRSGSGWRAPGAIGGEKGWGIRLVWRVEWEERCVGEMMSFFGLNLSIFFYIRPVMWEVVVGGYGAAKGGKVLLMFFPWALVWFLSVFPPGDPWRLLGPWRSLECSDMVGHVSLIQDFGIIVFFGVFVCFCKTCSWFLLKAFLITASIIIQLIKMS